MCTARAFALRAQPTSDFASRAFELYALVTFSGAASDRTGRTDKQLDERITVH